MALDHRSQMSTYPLVALDRRRPEAHRLCLHRVFHHDKEDRRLKAGHRPHRCHTTHYLGITDHRRFRVRLEPVMHLSIGCPPEVVHPPWEALHE